jgi:hypothetical protein
MNELIEAYLGDEVSKYKMRQVTPGRQGHWRPRRQQMKRMRRKTKPGRAPRRLATGRRRRKALVNVMRNKMLKSHLELIAKYNPNHDKRSGRFTTGGGAKRGGGSGRTPRQRKRSRRQEARYNSRERSEAKRVSTGRELSRGNYKGRGNVHGYDTSTNHPVRELRRQPRDRSRRRVLDLETGKVRTIPADRMSLGTL